MAMRVSAQRLFRSANPLLLPSEQTMKDKMDGVSLKNRKRDFFLRRIGDNSKKYDEHYSNVIDMTDNDIDGSVIDMNDSDKNLRTFWAPAAAR